MSVLPTHLPPRTPSDVSTDSHALRLPAEDISVRRARHALDRWLRERSACPDLREQAALVISELATNAVTHTDSEWIVCAAALAAPGTLWVVVHDDDSSCRVPERHAPTAEKESGRGLHIVGSLAHRWGVTPSPVTQGNAVWAQLQG